MLALYRVNRDFHFGALRSSLKAGALLESDGSIVRYEARVYPVVGFDQLVSAGFLVLEEEARQLPAQRDQEVLQPLGAKPPVRKEVESPSVASTAEEKGESIPAHLRPDKPHVWETDLFGNGQKTCTVCGVTLANPLSTNLSKQSLKFIYTDAYGVSISTLKELPCPVFVGDLGGGVASNTHRTRSLTGKVESIDERLSRLEAENAALRDRADRRQVVALDLLSRLVGASERLIALGDGEVGARLLPDRADIIDAIVVESPGGEKVPVPVRPLDTEEES